MGFNIKTKGAQIDSVYFAFSLKDGVFSGHAEVVSGGVPARKEYAECSQSEQAKIGNLFKDFGKDGADDLVVDEPIYEPAPAPEPEPDPIPE